MVNFGTMPDPTEADYTAWNADTVVELHNVPWNNDYRDIVEFASPAARKKWFDDRPLSARTKIDQLSYARINRPIALEIPFTTAYKYNYVRVINGPQTPVFNPRNEYFYFINQIEPTNPGVTSITVQLDFWTTFQHDVTFGKAYVERGHIGIANQNNFSNFGRDFLTVPEGLDVGNDYQVVHTVNEDVMYFNDVVHHNGSSMTILVASTVDWTKDPGDVNNPKLNTSSGSVVQQLPSGTTFYAFKNSSEFRGFLNYMANKPWVTQGIISISIVPDIARYGANLNPISVPGLPSGVRVYTFAEAQGISWNMKVNWRDSKELLRQIPLKYRKLRKFFTHPYMSLELTTFTGGPIVLKPELWNDPHAWVSEKIAITPPAQRIVHHPVKYNAGRGSTIVDRWGTNVFEDGGEYLDVQLVTGNLPKLSILNNGFLSYMASNSNSIQNSYQQAGWGQQKALASNATSYDQANSTIATGADNAMIGRNADIAANHQANQNAMMHRGLNAGAALGNGLANGGPIGLAGGAVNAAVGVVGTMMDVNNANAQMAIRNNAAAATQGNTQSNQHYLADTSKQLADFAARGDYAMSIASLNASVQDAQMLQPSVSGQAGGDTFNMANGGIVLSLRFKMINYNAICMIGDYWLRYGYAVQRFLTIDKLSVMSKFTYWKLSETYLVDTRLPEFIKQAIRGIFEKGVTVWQDPADIGIIDIGDNDPLPNIVIPVDDNPVETEPEPEPLTPNLDEVEKVYLAKTYNNVSYQYWAMGKEYLANLAEVNAGTEVPVKLVGDDYVTLTLAEFSNALRMCNIPDRFVNYTTFMSENPDGLWSKADENAAAIANVQTVAANNQTATATLLTQILETVSPADGNDTP